MTEREVNEAISWHDKGMSTRQIGLLLDVGATTVHTALKKAGKKPGARPQETALEARTFGYNLTKALTLRLVKHLTHDQIGKILGVSEGAIRDGLKDLEGLLNNTQMTTAFRENEAEILDAVRVLAIRAISEQLNDPKRRKKVDLLRLNNIYGTLFDKAQLLRGGATSIIHQLSQIIEQAHATTKPRESDSPHSSDAIDVTPEQSTLDGLWACGA